MITKPMYLSEILYFNKDSYAQLLRFVMCNSYVYHYNIATSIDDTTVPTSYTY
jgi:hypothetical protein